MNTMHLHETLWTVIWILTAMMSRQEIVHGCPIGYFGNTCQHKCHCDFPASCDSATGKCFGECARGFIGKPMCQIENVALNKTSDQNGDTKVTSVLVVDGNKVQDGSTYMCSRVVDTKFPFRAQWYVDLGGDYSLHSVKVYFRNDLPVNNPRREGVQVYVGDSPYDFRDVNACFKDVLKKTGIIAPPDVLDLKNCTKKGRYVTLYNDRPIVDPLNCPTATYSCWANLEICEVEVYACTRGTYGDSCENFCHCKTNTCDQQTGICPAGGCMDGWIGEKCDIACPDGSYGQDCSLSCGHCFDGDACNVVNGKCPRGCREGWTGSDCKAPCPQYKYGQNCTGSCTNCQGGADCDKATGFCPGKCQPNWFGVRCQDRCPGGTYGIKCEKKCGLCAKNDQCDFDNGSCPNGCVPGFLSDKCTQKCPSGFYGSNCKSKCGFCAEKTCDHVTGGCSSHCRIGWRGERCIAPCETGRFGEKCSRSCDQCKNKKCNHVTGLCELGCNNGWHQPRCDQMCPPGRFGIKCVEPCGHCLNNETCNHVTGECLNGCANGWNGTFCSSECVQGTYGQRCQDTCGKCLNGTVCHHQTGICRSGCQVGYYGRKCLSSTTGDDTDDSVQNAIIGGSLALIIITGFIVFICLTRHSRKKKPAKTESQRHRDANANEERLYANANINNAFVGEEQGTYDESESHRVSVGSSSTLYANSTYYNVARPLPGIAVENLARYVYDMENNYDKYREDFDELRSCPSYSHVVGQKKENKHKNRFLTTFPYDHSRVVLEEIPDEEHSDYINANYIDGVDQTKAYIATQGPNRNTIGDFWRMVWQEEIDRIVMLANIIEDGKVKCECYWPSHGPVSLANLVISLENTLEMAKYTIRSFTVTELQTMSSRHVEQYHFTGWPDHGVPDTVELVTFLNRVLRNPTSNKLLVHCSAGVGRTGTFIGLHALYTNGCISGRVDILPFVKKMRENRMTMVQNIEQYRLLHLALLEAFNYRHSSIRKSEFIQRYHQLLSKDANIMQEEFSLLQSGKPLYGEQDCAASMMHENINKNRTMAILAADQYRPYINTYIPGTNDYINAVIIPSCKPQGKYLVTQCPLPNTVVDFWRLILDHECYTIVTLNALDDDPEETGAWWPSEGESITYGPLTITTTAVSDITRGVNEKTFALSQKDYTGTREVKSYHLAGWSADHDLPTSVDMFLDLVDVTEAWKRNCANDVVTVQCLDGSSCSGLFCAISLVLDRLRLEEEVDIYHTLQRMLLRRPEFIYNMDQYRFVYDVIAEYVDSRGLYGNL